MAALVNVLERQSSRHTKCAAIRPAETTCRCGQDLALYMRAHCPRCGTNLA